MFVFSWSKFWPSSNMEKKKKSQQWPWIGAQYVSGRFARTAVWGKQFVLKVTRQLFGSARPELMTRLVSSFETRWQAFTSSGECTKCSWVESSPWKQAKLCIPKPSHAPLRLNPPGPLALRLSGGDPPTAWEWRRAMWRDTPASWHPCGFKRSRLTLEPWTIYGEHGVDRFTNSGRHRQLRGRLCCNIFLRARHFFSRRFIIISTGKLRNIAKQCTGC